ncbi:type III-A CRISPR-associated protein Csm2 [Thermodesulforhabdus norvegica]|uniref:CRISPR system Cms protein Csm2 n=1 Tax=Thermodesulforhabdus norvegica TaxID=39841 RepID=A0A1I4S7F4_9BACT|nr:type III-A CRISPR-associated protein Csm2 [Thermodesulforhabdus norvegica]SFM60438.1 CRISPR-associated protein Csm2 [Thermodesulforhabdus norvegica]
MSNVNYVEKLWMDKKNNIPNPKAFSEEAEKLARQVSTNSKGRGVNKSSQLRKFYDELFRLNQIAKPENWDVVLPQVHMVIAKAAYARGRGLITDDFLNPLRELIKAVEKPEHLNTVVSFFEAFTAFYRQYRRD